jgi:23S rRNA (guanosine2251-2'-O)-methyltransferase
MSELVVGRRPVIEALRAGTPLEKIVLLFGTRGETVQRIRILARQQGVPILEVDKKKFREICEDIDAQGVAALVASKAYVEIDDILAGSAKRGEPPFLVILDEIEDPHNLGALMRTAECVGAHGVVIPKHHAASVGRTVAKTSAGASLHLPVARVTNISQTLERLKRLGVWIVGTDASGDQLYDEVDYTGPIAIVVGNEGKGIRRLVKERCDFVVKIPLYGSIGSLNASVAGALILYEVVRSRRRTK